MKEFFNAFKEYIVNHPRIAEYKPTSKKFNATTLEDVKDKVEKGIVSTDEDEKAIVDFVWFSNYLSELYIELYKIIEENLNHLGLKGLEIAEYIVGGLNKEYKVIWDKRQETVKRADKGTYLLSDLMEYKLESSDPNIGYVDARAALESETDCINLLLNSLRYFLDEEFSRVSHSPSEFAARILHSIQCSQVAVVLKHSYDDILYNGGFIVIDNSSKTVTFDYDDRKNLKLLRAGDMMFTERRAQKMNLSKEKKESSRLNKYTTRYRIKHANIEDGIIKLTFSQGNTSEYKSILADIQAALDGYYEFMKGDTILPKFENSTVDEVIATLCAIQYICLFVVERVNYDVSVYTKEDFSEIPRKIKRIDLIDYIQKLTGIKSRKINTIIIALQADWTKFNDIWTSMLYQAYDYLLLPFFPILFSSPYNVIDRLLQRGGLNLEDRGKQFEDFLYDKLVGTATPYPITCLPAGKYGGTSGNMEEIDVLVSMKNAILIADAKCIHYSVEPINYGEAWGRLREGCEQALRKAEFLRKNPQYFGKLGDYSNKQIIPFVVTNYPTFTGFSHNGVFVIDYHSFLSYMHSGIMTMRTMTISGDYINNRWHFYKNEDEYSDEFIKYLSDNPHKTTLMNVIEIQDHPLGALGDSWRILSKSAQVRTDSQFNIPNGPIVR